MSLYHKRRGQPDRSLATVSVGGNTYEVEGVYTPGCRGRGDTPDDPDEFDLKRVWLIDAEGTRVRICLDNMWMRIPVICTDKIEYYSLDDAIVDAAREYMRQAGM